MQFLSHVLLMAPPQEGASPWPNFIFLGSIVLIFYFFMIRPQSKKLKEQKNFLADLKKGDRIVTTGGIHGKIVEMSDTTIVVQSLDSKFKMDRSGISVELSKEINKTPE